MPQRFAQYGGAAGADDALRQLIAERLAAEQEIYKREVEGRKLGQTDRGLQLEGGRLDLSRSEFGQKQREYTEAAPMRGAQLADLQSQTGYRLGAPLREADARAQQGLMEEKRHQNELSQIQARGNQEARVAGIRSTTEPLHQVQLPDGRIVYMPRSQAVGAQPPPPAALRTQADAMKSVGNAMTEIKKFSDTINTQAGPAARVSGALRTGMGAVGLDPRAKVFRDTRAANAIRLSRALGEVGVLTNQDIQRAVSLIPDLGSTREEATLKFQQLEQLINSALTAKGLPPIAIGKSGAGTGITVLSIEEVP
jgi:hypothetical protein